MAFDSDPVRSRHLLEGKPNQTDELAAGLAELESGARKEHLLANLDDQGIILALDVDLVEQIPVQRPLQELCLNSVQAGGGAPAGDSGGDEVRVLGRELRVGESEEHHE